MSLAESNSSDGNVNGGENSHRDGNSDGDTNSDGEETCNGEGNSNGPGDSTLNWHHVQRNGPGQFKPRMAMLDFRV